MALLARRGRRFPDETRPDLRIRGVRGGRAMTRLALHACVEHLLALEDARLGPRHVTPHTVLLLLRGAQTIERLGMLGPGPAFVNGPVALLARAGPGVAGRCRRVRLPERAADEGGDTERERRRQQFSQHAAGLHKPDASRRSDANGAARRVIRGHPPENRQRAETDACSAGRFWRCVATCCARSGASSMQALMDTPR